MNDRTCHDVRRCARRLRRTGVVLASLVAMAAPLRAQLAVDHLELQLQPAAGRPVTGVVLVTNPDNAPTTAQVHVADWDRLPGGANRFLPPGRYVLLLLVDYGAPDLLAGQLETVVR